MRPLGRPYRGLVFRGHDPYWSFAPDSGAGAKCYGGRFNPPGLETLYTSISYDTAWAEAQQAFPFKPQPLTLVAYDVDYDAVLDLCDATVRDKLSITLDMLDCPWEDIALQGLEPPSWALVRRFIDEGVTAILVPSFAPGAPPDGRNVVFWSWSDVPPRQVRVIDDTGRLPLDQSSWQS